MVVVLTQTNHAKGITPTPYPSFAGEVCVARAEVTVPASGGGAVVNDIYEMLRLPPGCRVRDLVIDSDDLDTNGSPTITFDVGFMSGTPGDNDITRTVGQEFFVASNVGQAGTTARPTLKTAFRQAVSAAEKAIGLKVVAAPATGAAGTVGLMVFYSTD